MIGFETNQAGISASLISLLEGEVIEVVTVLLAGEGGAGLVDALEFTVAEDLGIGVVDLQGAEQGDEGMTLGRGSGVGSMAFYIQASLVADTDGVLVVMTGMGTDLFLRPALMELAVTGDVVVVADAFPATGLMHLVEHLDGDVLVGTAGGTVDDNHVDLTHGNFQ